MSMPSPATVAALIVSDTGVPLLGQAAAQANWVAILTRIQAMIAAGTVSVSVPGTGLVAPNGGGPVTGAGAGTGALT